MFHSPLFLAIDVSAIIAIVVFILFSIIGSFSKSAQKKKASSSGKAAPSGSSPPDVSLEDMAAKRRQQLQELAKQRGAQAGQASAQQAPAAQQTPIQTLVQQTQAQQTQAQQTQTRFSSSSAPPTQPGPAEVSPYATKRQVEAARRQALEAQRQRQQAELARRQQAEQALRQQQQQQARRQAPQQSARPRRRPARSKISPLEVSYLGQGATEISPVHDWDADTGESSTHRNVSDAAYTIVSKTSKKSSLNLRFDKMSIKQAFILKELIDPPIALRENDNSPF